MKNSNLNILSYKKTLYDLYSKHEQYDGVPEWEFMEHFFFSEGSLRLTYHGFKLLRKKFSNFEFEIKGNMACKHYLALCNTLNAPYYFNAKKVFLFGKYDAFVSMMHGNDIHCMLDKGAEKWEENQNPD